MRGDAWVPDGELAICSFALWTLGRDASFAPPPLGWRRLWLAAPYIAQRCRPLGRALPGLASMASALIGRDRPPGGRDRATGTDPSDGSCTSLQARYSPSSRTSQNKMIPQAAANTSMTNMSMRVVGQAASSPRAPIMLRRPSPTGKTGPSTGATPGAAAATGAFGADSGDIGT